MQKRRGTSLSRATASRAKRARKVREVNPVEQKCKMVARALRKNVALPCGVRAMYSEGIPFSLSIFKEERHAYQQSMVEAVEREMLKQEATMKKNIVETKRRKEKTEADRAGYVQALADREAELTSKRQDAYDKKVELAKIALTFRRAKEALTEAEAKQKACDKELKEIATKHTGLGEAISDVLEPLKDGTMEKEKVPMASAMLIPTLQCYFEIEESLVPAIPTVLSKPPSTRGPFDTMAAVQLEEQAKKAMADFAAAIKGGEAAKAQHAAAVAEAAKVLKGAKEAQRVSAGVYREAMTKEVEAEAARRAAQAPLKSFWWSFVGQSKVAARAERNLVEFREGPMAAFKDLVNRNRPPAEEDSAEAASAAAAAELAEAEAPTESAAAADA